MRTQGIILPAALIFLMVFAMLGISALTLAQLEMRMGSNAGHRSCALQDAEAGLRTAERILQTPLLQKCLISLQPKPWQSKTSCTMSIEHNSVHYVIEALPNLDRQYVLHENCRYKAMYYRLTAWVSLTEELPTILQSTYAVAGLPCPDCNIVIQPGRMSWREIEF